MWTLFLIPIMTMAIGFLLGVVVMDAFADNSKVEKLERQIKRLERRLKNEV